MIISEKQVIKLIQLANMLAQKTLVDHLDKIDTSGTYESINDFLNEIISQQSTELKDVK
jgi:hypothetical protein